MTVVRFYPTRFNRLSRDIDQTFEHLFSDGWNESVSNGKWNPRIDVSENADELLLNVELPGIDREDIQIYLEDEVLKIEGERKKAAAEEGVNYLREERRYGKFSRVFKINTRIDADKIDARFINGVLTIRLPKAEEVKPRQIEVKVG